MSYIKHGPLFPDDYGRPSEQRWQSDLSTRQQYRRDAEETMKAAREILSKSGLSAGDYEKARVLIEIAQIYMKWSEAT